MLIKICRLCCANEGTIDLFFNTDGLTPYYKILYCFDKAKICIEKNDNLPKRICLQCENELSYCYNFILKCEAASKKFCSLVLTKDTEYNAHVLNEINHEYKSDSLNEVNSCSTEVKDEYNISDDDNIVGNAVLPFNKEVSSSENLSQRKRRKESNKIPLKCPTCSKCFFYNSVLLKHIKIHLQESTSIMTKMKKSKISNITENNEKPVKRSLGQKECPVCHNFYLNNSLLISHLKIHTDMRPFKCSSCNKTYKDPIGLKRHEKSHLESKNYVCDNCGKCLVSKTSLAIHKRIHTGEKPYQCNFCSTKFSQNSALIMHKRRLHTGVKPYKCTQCTKRFVSKYELQMHFISHSSVKKYNCIICNKWFKFKNILKKHIETHGNKTKFICDYCGFVCNYKINLITHISRMHSTKSGFCNICLKQESNIIEHMGKHNGDRPFKCEYCASKFLDKRGLQYHVNFKHTKSNKYKCSKDGCEASFPSRPMLNYHNNKVHATFTPFPCDLCSRSFYRKSDYARHKIGTHKEELDNK